MGLSDFPELPLEPPEPPEEKPPRCPVCLAETDTFYRNRDYDIIGCDCCVRSVDAWEVVYGTV